MSLASDVDPYISHNQPIQSIDLDKVRDAYKRVTTKKQRITKAAKHIVRSATALVQAETERKFPQAAKAASERLFVTQFKRLEDRLVEALVPFFRAQVQSAAAKLAPLAAPTAADGQKWWHGTDAKNCGIGPHGFLPGNSCAKGGGDREITISGDGNFEDHIAWWGLPKGTTKEDIADLAGALPGSKVDIAISKQVAGGFFDVHVQHNDYWAERVLSKDFKYGQEFPTVRNYALQVYRQGRGIGTEILKQQVDAGVRLGVGYLSAQASGEKNSTENGYYTWPRLGYDGPIGNGHIWSNQKVYQELKAKFPKAEKISDVMESAGGREWWKENGEPFEVKFDLSEGSYSRRVLDDYIRSKEARGRRAEGRNKSGTSSGVDGGGRGDPGSDLGSDRRGEAVEGTRSSSDLTRLIFNPDDWHSRLVESLVPVMAQGMFESAKATATQFKREWRLYGRKLAQKNCGIGSGGFLPGNQCAKGDGSGFEIKIEGDKVGKMDAQKRVDARIEDILGRKVQKGDYESIARMAGALPGSKVTLKPSLDFEAEQYGSLTVEVEHKDYWAMRLLGQKKIYNSELNVVGEAMGKGLGTKIFATQVSEAAKVSSIQSIETTAAGIPGSKIQNGYYTWARLGYDAPLYELKSSITKHEKKWATKLEEKFPDAKRLSDLMASKEGRDWWKKNGKAFSAKFDLSEGSDGRKVLAKYVQEKLGKEAAKQFKDIDPSVFPKEPPPKSISQLVDKSSKANNKIPPPPDLLTGKKNPAAFAPHQNKLNALYEAAKTGDKAKVEAVKVNMNAASAYPKKVADYKKSLLAAMDNGASVDKTHVIPSPIKTTGTIDPSKFPAAPVIQAGKHKQIVTEALNKINDYAKSGKLDKLPFTFAQDLAFKSLHPSQLNAKALIDIEHLDKYLQDLKENVARQVHGVDDTKLATDLEKHSKSFNAASADFVLKDVGKWRLLGNIDSVPEGIPDGHRLHQQNKSDQDHFWNTGKDIVEKAGIKRAIGDYTGDGYDAINAKLRNRMPDYYGKQIADVIIKKGVTLPVGFRLDRSHEGDPKWADMKPGDVISDRGLLSTSTSIKSSNMDTIVKMVAGPGVKGLPVKSHSGHPGENEVLLAPNQRLVVTKVTTASGLENVTGNRAFVVHAMILPTLPDQYGTHEGSKSLLVAIKNCGTGAGGFKPGNTCHKGGSDFNIHVVLNEGQTELDLLDSIKAVFQRPGKGTDLDSIARLSGAQPGYDVEISPIGKDSLYYPGISVLFANKDRTVDGERIFMAKDGDRDFMEGEPNMSSKGQIENYRLNIEPSEARKGLGTRILATQVDEAIKIGTFDKIHTTAAGFFGSKRNGYYTWPRLGYDASLVGVKKDHLFLEQKLNDNYPNAKMISDIFATEGGPKWWRENGKNIDVAFDLTSGSLSRRVLHTYLTEKFGEDHEWQGIKQFDAKRHTSYGRDVVATFKAKCYDELILEKRIKNNEESILKREIWSGDVILKNGDDRFYGDVVVVDGGIGRKASTASEWAETLAEYGIEPDDLDVVTPYGKYTLELATEYPEWMKGMVKDELEDLFSQDYWRAISETTEGDIDDILSKGILDGQSIETMARMMNAEFGDDYPLRRGRLVATTETGGVLNGARKKTISQLIDEMGLAYAVKVVWWSVLGPTTRRTHGNLHGVPAGLDGKWSLGGIRCSHPGDFNLPIEERANCQCTVISEFGMTDDVAAELVAGSSLRAGAAGKAWMGDKNCGIGSHEKAFCPTGPGGGVDPTCPSGGGGGASGYKVRVSDYEQEQVDSLAHDLFGPGNHYQKIASLTGAQKGANVRLEIRTLRSGDLALRARVDHEDNTKSYDMERIFYKDENGKKVIVNDGFGVEQKGQGLGTKIFTDQVKAATEHGFDRIETRASSHRGQNGSYTWARLGYDGKLSTWSLNDLARDPDVPNWLKSATTIHDLITRPGGREWWIKNHSSFDGVFDLKPGSLSHKILDYYNEQKELARQYGKSYYLDTKNCGIGSTGFLPGNQCAKGGGFGPVNQREHIKNWDEAVAWSSGSEMDVVREYQGMRHDQLNRKLRAGEDLGSDPRLKQIDETLELLHSQGKFNAKGIVMRGVSQDHKLSVGSVYQDKAWQSASTSFEVATRFTIDTPKQSRRSILRFKTEEGLLIPGNESEILLAKNSKYKVVAVQEHIQKSSWGENIPYDVYDLILVK